MSYDATTDVHTIKYTAGDPELSVWIESLVQPVQCAPNLLVNWMDVVDIESITPQVTVNDVLNENGNNQLQILISSSGPPFQGTWYLKIRLAIWPVVYIQTGSFLYYENKIKLEVGIFPCDRNYLVDTNIGFLDYD